MAEASVDDCDMAKDADEAGASDPYARRAYGLDSYIHRWMRKPVVDPIPVFSVRIRTRLLAAVAKLEGATKVDLSEMLGNNGPALGTTDLVAMRVLRIERVGRRVHVMFNSGHPAHREIFALATAMIPFCNLVPTAAPRILADIPRPKVQEDISHIAPTLFGYETRSEVLHLLACLGEATAAELLDLIPGKKFSAIWIALRSLERWGLVRIRSEGRHRPASLDPRFPAHREFKAALDRFNEIYPSFKARARLFRRIPRDTMSR